jgi:rhodanese-related sulfurtransferase
VDWDHSRKPDAETFSRLLEEANVFDNRDEAELVAECWPGAEVLPLEEE